MGQLAGFTPDAARGFPCDGRFAAACATDLRDFEPAGPVTLGLNGNEANILCRLHDLPCGGADAASDGVLAQALSLREVLGISRVVIHRTAFAACAGCDGGYVQAGPYCANAGLFVRRARGASNSEPVDFLDDWSAGHRELEKFMPNQWRLSPSGSGVLRQVTRTGIERPEVVKSEADFTCFSMTRPMPTTRMQVPGVG